jgi:hypothetical protein
MRPGSPVGPAAELGLASSSSPQHHELADAVGHVWRQPLVVHHLAAHRLPRLLVELVDGGADGPAAGPRGQGSGLSERKGVFGGNGVTPLAGASLKRRGCCSRQGDTCTYSTYSTYRTCTKNRSKRQLSSQCAGQPGPPELLRRHASNGEHCVQQPPVVQLDGELAQAQVAQDLGQHLRRAGASVRVRPPGCSLQAPAGTLRARLGIACSIHGRCRTGPSPGARGAAPRRAAP